MPSAVGSRLRERASALGIAPAALKARCNRSHALRRASERYEHLGLTMDDIVAIEERIHLAPAPDCVPIRPDGLGKDRPLYAVKHAGEWLPVVFDGATDSVMSVLPSRVLDGYRASLEAPPPTPEGIPVALRPPLVLNDGRVPIGQIVGFVPPDHAGIRPKNKIHQDIPKGPSYGLSSLPSDPDDPGDSASVEEIQAAIDRFNVRRIAVNAAIAETSKRHLSRPRWVAELERINEAVRGLKVRKKAMNERAWLKGKVDEAHATGIDLDDPEALIRAAYRFIGSVGNRLEWKLTEEEFAVKNALEYHLYLSDQSGNLQAEGSETTR